MLPLIMGCSKMSFLKTTGNKLISAADIYGRLFPDISGLKRNIGNRKRMRALCQAPEALALIG
jgi:hypothetical protein